jgi:hypothetical protein
LSTRTAHERAGRTESAAKASTRAIDAVIRQAGMSQAPGT